jgi:hypothetical protein
LAIAFFIYRRAGADCNNPMTNGNAPALGGEVLGTVENRRNFPDMLPEQKDECARLHRIMTTMSAQLVLLRKNNDGMSLAPPERAYYVAGSQRLYVPFENVRCYTGTDEQAQAARIGMQMSNDGDGWVLSAPMVSFQGPAISTIAGAGGLPALSMGDVLALLLITGLVIAFYRSPTQLRELYAAAIGGSRIL